MTTTQTESSTVSRGAGPLTTVFTTPDFCKSLYWQNTETQPLSSSVCMPPRFHQLWDYQWGYYSPGICPTGYSNGCDFPKTLASTSNGMVYYGGPFVEGESVRVCCPTGYTCLTSDTYSYSKCVATTDASDLVFALQVRWKESDLSILETNPTVPGSTYSAPATAAATTTESGASSASSGTAAVETSNSASETTSAADSASTSATSGESGESGTSGTSDQISHTSTIAIAVGAMVAAFIFSGLLFFFWRWRKRKQRDRTGNRLSSTISLDKIVPGGVVSEKPELDSTMVVPHSPSPTELQGEREVVEMEVPHFVAELPGSMPSGYHERVESGVWPVSPVDTARMTEMGEPSPISATSGSRRRRMSFGNPPTESPTIPQAAFGNHSSTRSNDSVSRNRQSVVTRSSTPSRRSPTQDHPR